MYLEALNANQKNYNFVFVRMSPHFLCFTIVIRKPPIHADFYSHHGAYLKMGDESKREGRGMHIYLG